MFRICFSLFATGIILGAGPCLASCGPILISYIAATKRSPLGGLWSWLVFSVSRVLVYIFLGLIAGFAGAELFHRFYWEVSGYIIWFIGGIFISSLGVLIFLGKESRFNVCRLLNESLIQKDTKSLIALGVIIGIFPCAPLIGIFSYIMMVSTHFSQGILMSAAFGLGTVISPMIFLGMLAGSIPKLKVLQNEKNLLIFQRICGGILFLLGMFLIVRTVTDYIRMA